MPDRTPHSSASRATFHTTQWSLVLTAGGDSPESGRALASLCESYWSPLYAFARRQGKSVDEAADCTQAFFTKMLERDVVGAADPDRGRFRSFLLASFKHFLANQRERENARKRAGSVRHVSIDTAKAETDYELHAADTDSPEHAFERQWAMSVIEQTLAQLKREHADKGKLRLFDATKAFITVDGQGETYAAISAELGATEGALRVAVARLRRRYRELIRAEITKTVACPEEVDDEIRRMFTVLGAKN